MKNDALADLKQIIAALLVAMLMALVITLNYAYASSATTNPAVSVDISRTTDIDVTNAWQTHYAVNGFVNTGPADPYQIFKIHYRAINGTVEQFSMPYVEIAHNIQANVTSDGDGLLQIRFPKNYPSGNTELGGEAIFFINEQAVFPEGFSETDCFFEFSFSFSNDAVIDVVWGFFDDSFRGAEVPEDCLPETIVQDVVKKNGIITPLHQVKAGVIPEEVVCRDYLTFVMHPKGKSYCATPTSAELLKQRWSDSVSTETVETTVTLDVGGEPRQEAIQSGMGDSLMTTYLPVNMTQTIILKQPTQNLTIYPIFADWDGIVRGEGSWTVHDKSGNPISFNGVGNLSLHAVKATCTDPYFVEVQDTDIGEDGIKLEPTQAPVSSTISWGDTIDGHFYEPQSGTVTFTTKGNGIVPEDYNNSNDGTYRNNGAGNQKISGLYHLSFTSFYHANVNLPENADVTSSVGVVCTVDEDSMHISKSELSHIFVYDVWFRIE